MKYDKEILVKLEEQEKDAPIVFREGQYYLLLNDNQRIIKVAPDKGLFRK